MPESEHQAAIPVLPGSERVTQRQIDLVERTGGMT